MISRNRIYSKQAPSRDARKIYIVCEGKETEPAYFSFFKELSSNLEIITIPPEEGTDPLKLLDLAKMKFEGDLREHTIDYKQNDAIWFVIDTDTWEKEGKIEPLRNFCNTKNSSIPKEYDEVKSYNAWNVAQSNPCFEIWLYYHFYDKRPDNKEVEECNTFKEFVGKKINGGFNYDADQVRLSEAIENAEKIFKDSDNKLSIYSTEVYLLGKDILSFVRKELNRLRGKLK